MTVTAPAPLTFMRRVERYAIAHASGYLLALLWAVAAIPLTIHLSVHAIDALEGDLPAIGRLVVRRLVWPAAAAFTLPHLLAIPWAFGRDPARVGRKTWIAIGAVAATGIAFGAAS